MKRVNQAVGTVFEAAELSQAVSEMEREQTQISSINKNGLYVGTTRPNGNGLLCCYDSKDMFVDILNFLWGTTRDGRLDAISTPSWMFELEGTEFENEAVAMSHSLAAYEDCLESPDYDLVFDQMNELKTRARHLL